jgi:hypothetical protein
MNSVRILPVALMRQTAKRLCGALPARFVAGERLASAFPAVECVTHAEQGRSHTDGIARIARRFRRRLRAVPTSLVIRR